MIETAGIDTWVPFEVHEDGTVTRAPGLYGPESVEGRDDNDYSDLVPWVPVSGFSGQHGYRGPVMHDSEYLGGGMLEYMLETPGVYVCAPVWWDSDDRDPYTGELEPYYEGWMLLRYEGGK